MITRIELTNFMSHERTVIEPAPGLTVLVGPNNCGKSAVVAALQILCNNTDSTYVTRHGAKECSVRLETDDGHLIEWRRKSSPSYRINGEKFDRLGRNNAPDQLRTALRLPRVQIGDDQDFDVHFGEQKSPIFLLDRPASHAAKFFASSSDVDRFLKMQDLHRSKVTDAKAQKQRLEEESVAVNRELELLEPLVELDTCLESTEKEYDELLTLARSIDQLTSDSAEIQRQAVMVDRHAARLASLAGLLPPPELQSTEALESLVAGIGQVRQLLAHISAQVEAIGVLHHPPELEPTDALSALVEEIGRTARQLDRRHGVSTALASLSAPPPQEDADSLARLGQDLIATTRLVTRWGGQSRYLASLHVPPQLDDDIALAMTLDQLITAERCCTQLAEEKSLLFGLRSAPVLEDVGAAFELLRSLEDSHSRTIKCRRSIELLAAIEPAPAPADTSALAELIDRLETAIQTVTDAATLAATASDDFSQTRQELLNWARANGICPTCGGAIDAERLVAHLSCQGDAAHA